MNGRTWASEHCTLHHGTWCIMHVYRCELEICSCSVCGTTHSSGESVIWIVNIWGVNLVKWTRQPFSYCSSFYFSARPEFKFRKRIMRSVGAKILKYKFSVGNSVSVHHRFVCFFPVKSLPFLTYKSKMNPQGTRRLSKRQSQADNYVFGVRMHAWKVSGSERELFETGV